MPFESPDDRLHGAARRNDGESIRKALGEGADPNSTDRYGLTSLDILCMASAVFSSPTANGPSVALLLEAGADPGRCACDPLAQAVMAGHEGAVRALLDSGMDPNATHPRAGEPLLVCAVMRNSQASVGALLDAGADPNAPLQNGTTAVHVAAEEGFHESLALVLARGGNPGAKDAAGADPLRRTLSSSLAAGGSDDDEASVVCSLLIGAGADASSVRPDGRSRLSRVLAGAWRRLGPQTRGVLEAEFDRMDLERKVAGRRRRRPPPEQTPSL